jgi:hypothetical protein
VLAYVPNFNQGNWWHLTLSFEGYLPFSGNGAYDCVDYWNVCKETMQRLVVERTIRGAYWVEEISVGGFLPLRVKPHVHALVEADEVPLTNQDMQTWTATHQDSNSEPLTLVPSVKAQPIVSERMLLNTVEYLFKPIDLVRPYTTAWSQAVDHESREGATELNNQASEFVGGFSRITYRRPKMRAKGVLDPRHSRFVGVQKDERNGYREYISTLRQSYDEWDRVDS